jgi:uncharacterized protein (DUF4415 family)
MRKATHTQMNNDSEDMRSEYKFDYRKARPNRFAGRPRDAVIVMLDADVAEVFTTPESVNNILRALISAMPHPGRKTSTK